MSNTGTYVHRNGKLVKISDEIPKLGFVSTFYIGEPYWDTNIDDKPIYIDSRKKLYRELKQRGLSQKLDKKHGAYNVFRKQQLWTKKLSTLVKGCSFEELQGGSK